MWLLGAVARSRPTEAQGPQTIGHPEGKLPDKRGHVTRPRDRLGTPGSWLDLKGTAERESRPRVTCRMSPFRCPRGEARWAPGLGTGAGQALPLEQGRRVFSARTMLVPPAKSVSWACSLCPDPAARFAFLLLPREQSGVFIIRLSQNPHFKVKSHGKLLV